MRLRPLAATAALVLSLGVLAACGSGSGSDDEPASSGADETSSDSAFPVTVEHRLGETVIEAEPERVVSVGLTEQDILLELGVTPVAVTEWYGEQPFATWPWAQDLLGDAEPVVLSQSDGIEFEKVAALEPDLIIGTNSGMTKKDYELLSAIAPTVTNVKGSTPYFSPWQDQVLQVSRALGREADGQALVDEVEGKYEAVRDAHPEWEGKTATFSQGGPYDGILYVYPDGLSTSFLTDLGFTMTEGLEGFAPDIGSQAEISAENTALIEADVVVFATEDADMFDFLQDFGTIDTLPAVTENRSVYTDGTLAGALYFLTPLSLDYALERLTPMLEQAVAGEAPREFPA
ncbi:ABC transporter substrate-binding protein [Nocardioides sp. YIM 152315]|uniref:iron-siderophore ABC transporter substrate-binding protein n=1 Tax=Nocardioides sp. YIM 152315 TaxID=3031760 RepID=UPI0023DA8304|nr:ABC transporter substrate-binding protein [Nocardioides sp. YIM 152315]MDF1602905.1 ABC transporter substrate-binding protein [Nocardioides sp. YIM 152315]